MGGSPIKILGDKSSFVLHQNLSKKRSVKKPEKVSNRNVRPILRTIDNKRVCQVVKVVYCL